MAYCDQCGQAIITEAKFCNKCGNPVTFEENQDDSLKPSPDISINKSDPQSGSNKTQKRIAATGLLAALGLAFLMGVLDVADGNVFVTLLGLAILAFGIWVSVLLFKIKKTTHTLAALLLLIALTMIAFVGILEPDGIDNWYIVLGFVMMAAAIWGAVMLYRNK